MPGYSVTYAYDEALRPVAVTEVIEGKSFITSTIYDAASRLLPSPTRQA
jgi:hypothetical protein